MSGFDGRMLRRHSGDRATGSGVAPTVIPSDEAYRPSWAEFVRGARPLPLLTLPLIYSLVVPLLLLDAWMSIYQAICFRIYRIARVPRHAYFAFDRHRLRYLHPIERFHCFYCSYANGLLAYIAEIAARTEQYWCPIQHARTPVGTHRRYTGFAPFGAAAAYRNELDRLRRALAPTPTNGHE